jgi:FAD/FMN-containing dehydrogenase
MTVGARAVEKFASGLRGQLIREGAEGYEQARRIWNEMIDRKPWMIARCLGTQDVVRAVNFGRDHGIQLSVRGGGHSAAGNAICEAGLVIDLSAMKAVRVDPEARIAIAEGGATLRDLDAATQAHGLATTGGVVSNTGIAGLTLGGGFGILMRKHGLTCDNLLEAEVVTADGRIQRASAEENPELFWALRGGGGNFGVVTSFTYRVHPARRILWGPVIHPIDRAASVLRHYLERMEEAPDELQAYAGFLFAPDGAPVFAVVPAWVGPIDEGLRALRPLREFGIPMADMVETVAYVDHRALFDGAYPPGFRNYWKASMVGPLTDEVIAGLARAFAEAASNTSGTGIALERLGGAVARVGAADTAFAHRGSAYSVLVTASWMDSAQDAANRDWVRGAWEMLRPSSTGGVYLNYMQNEAEEGDVRVREAYGVNYARLAELKARYDPENLFRMNQNIRPARN